MSNITEYFCEGWNGCQRTLGKADCPPSCQWASYNHLKALIRLMSPACQLTMRIMNFEIINLHTHRNQFLKINFCSYTHGQTHAPTNISCTLLYIYPHLRYIHTPYSINYLIQESQQLMKTMAIAHSFSSKCLIP
jgi:hypothetical protein